MSNEVKASKPYVRRSQDGDVHYIASRLRRADLDEIQASTGLPPLEALQASVAISTETYAGVYQDRPFCLFGVAPHPDERFGIIWMVATDEISVHRREFLKQAVRELDLFHDRYKFLENCVDERNTAHIRWLKWMGAVFIRRHPSFGHEGRPFLEFIHVRTNQHHNARYDRRHDGSGRSRSARAS